MVRTLHLAAGTVVLSAAAIAAPASFHYRDFRNTTGLNLIGGARVVDRGIRLVPAQKDSRGNVWTQQAYPVAQDFRASFTFRYRHQGGSTDGSGNPGNDGLLFYIQPGSSALQQDMEIPARSLMLFFDGYRNYDADDVSSSRLEVKLDQKRLGQTDLEPLGIRYRTGEPVRVRVEYRSGCLSIFTNDRLAATYSKLDLASISPGYVGFHGMGGDAYADVDILNFRLESDSPRNTRKTAKTDLTLHAPVRQ